METPDVVEGQPAVIVVHCIWCNGPRDDVAGRRGRPRLWCSASCRNRAYRARLILADAASGGHGDDQTS